MAMSNEPNDSGSPGNTGGGWADQVEAKVPGWFATWVAKRPVLNSVICLAAGAAIAKFLFC